MDQCDARRQKNGKKRQKKGVLACFSHVFFTDPLYIFGEFPRLFPAKRMQ